jgi:spore maturation protein SpmB
LTAAGLEMFFEEAWRFLGALLFASGVLGWVSLLTDPAFSGVPVPTQPVHVAFAALFCLSCVAWGVALFSEAAQFA